jgi:hypothetical protein
MTEKQIADFGTWESNLTAPLLFQERRTASNPIPWGGGVLFLLTVPKEQNALALMYCDLAGKLSRVSPSDFSLRSRVHEYGGLLSAAVRMRFFTATSKIKRFIGSCLIRAQSVLPNPFNSPIRSSVMCDIVNSLLTANASV